MPVEPGSLAPQGLDVAALYLDAGSHRLGFGRQRLLPGGKACRGPGRGFQRRQQPVEIFGLAPVLSQSRLGSLQCLRQDIATGAGRLCRIVRGAGFPDARLAAGHRGWCGERRFGRAQAT